MRFPIPQEKWTGAGYHWLDWTGQAFHPGLDMNTAPGNNDRGEPIFAWDFGTVYKIDHSSGGYGKQIIVQHFDGTYSRYAHLDTLLVKEGEFVTPFTQIGTLGNTGATTSAHLHFELCTTKLITHLKSVRPLDWFRFYPNGYSKKWVTEHYLNPNTHCTQTVRLLNIFYDTPKPSGIQHIEELKKWIYNASGTQLKLEVDTIEIPPRPNPIPWVTTTFRGGIVGKMIDQAWLRYWILARGTGYDVVALHLLEKYWQGGEAIAYSPVPKQLGIQPIIARCEEGISPRYSEFCGGNIFIGQLRHELGHALFSACGQQNIDSVHTLEPLHKLEDIFKTMRLTQFEGWKPKRGVRMFKYGATPNEQKLPFSGIPKNNKVYRTTDYRLYFVYENGWRQITESEFESAVKTGYEFGEMAVAEGNQIIESIGGSIPSFVGTSIMEQLAFNQDRRIILEKNNWQTIIPSSHIKL